MFTQALSMRFVLQSTVIIATLFLAPATGLRPAMAEVVDPLADGPVDPDLFNKDQVATPNNATANIPQQPAQQQDLQTALYQAAPQTQTPFADDPAKAPAISSGPVASSKDPCAATPNKPLNELGIGIGLPAGKLPTDLATACWEQINQKEAGHTVRSWPVYTYQWDATCLYHRPLYFEEINLERYGYQCGDACCYPCECCLQPAASAAHFFGTVPLLPYCIAYECPGDHIYTLGHYRPGSRPPWRWHWPLFDPIAALAEGGAWTALILVFP